MNPSKKALESAKYIVQRTLDFSGYREDLEDEIAIIIDGTVAEIILTSSTKPHKSTI